MNIYIYIYIHTYVYVCVYVYIHIYIYIYIDNNHNNNNDNNNYNNIHLICIFSGKRVYRSKMTVWPLLVTLVTFRYSRSRVSPAAVGKSFSSMKSQLTQPAAQDSDERVLHPVHGGQSPIRPHNAEVR